jgi:hypothetical protein
MGLSLDRQRLIGLMNRMRLFAPPRVVSGAEVVLRAIVEISLQPGVELRQLAKEALSKSLDPDPLSGIQPGLPGRLGQRAPIGGVGNVAAPTRAAPVPALTPAAPPMQTPPPMVRLRDSSHSTSVNLCRGGGYSGSGYAYGAGYGRPNRR